MQRYMLLLGICMHSIVLKGYKECICGIDFSILFYSSRKCLTFTVIVMAEFHYVWDTTLCILFFKDFFCAALIPHPCAH